MIRTTSWPLQHIGGTNYSQWINQLSWVTPVCKEQSNIVRGLHTFENWAMDSLVFIQIHCLLGQIHIIIVSWVQTDNVLWLQNWIVGESCRKTASSCQWKHSGHIRANSAAAMRGRSRRRKEEGPERCGDIPGSSIACFCTVDLKGGPKKKKSYESRVWRCALRNVERPLTWACVGLWGQGWGVNGTQTVDPDLRSNNKIHLGLTFVLTTAWNNQDHTVKSEYPLFTLYIYIVHNHQQATSADVIWIELLCKSKIFAQMSKRSNFMNSHCI